MKKVLWVMDEANWAYDVNAKALAKYMQKCEHSFAYCAHSRSTINTGNFDVVVVMYPPYIKKCDKFDNIIVILDSVRAAQSINPTLLSKVAGIICCNEFLYDLAKTRNSMVILQPNGVDLDFYCPPEVKIERKFTVGFAANTTGKAGIYKGWPVYEEAMAGLLGIVDRFDVQYGISQIPPDRMVEDFYHKIDCFILLSENEGCSNVITEALACGLPIICTKVGYHGHALTDHKQCVFVNRDVSEVKSAIIEVCNNKELRDKMVYESRIFASLNHSIAFAGWKYSKFFEDCV